MKQIIYDIRNARGLGDTISATPTLKKLFHSYEKKIIVITVHPEVFTGNPYVLEVLDPEEADKKLNYSDYLHHKSFDNVGNPDNRGVETKHNTMDIRQIHATGLGFMLSGDELQTEYYRTTDVIIPNLPENYVLIHPVQSWPNRTWSAENWQTLVKKLNERGTPVVSIGKDSSEIGFHNVQKPVFNFQIDLGLNLMNNTTLDEAHYLIENAMCIITMDSGMLHLAGTTDTEIILLGSAINPKLRIPFRNGSQDYKVDYIQGGCDLMCASDMKYGVHEWKTIHGVPPLVKCLENKPTYECHPTVDKVLKRVIGLVEPFYRKNELHKTPNIKLVHLLLDLEQNFDISKDKWESNIDRQKQSVECYSQLSNRLTTYTQINSFVNRTELPRPSVDIDLSHRVFESIEHTQPPHLSYGHFGAFNAHRRALTTEFTEDVDALIVVESDVVFDMSPDEMYKEIMKAYEFGKKNNAAMVTFAGCFFDSKFPNSYQYVEELDEYYKIPHFILGSMYMVFKPQRNILKHKFKNSGWHSPDLWLAENYHLEYPIFGTKEIMVRQAMGYSLIDYKIKDTHGNYYEDQNSEKTNKETKTPTMEKFYNIDEQRLWNDPEMWTAAGHEWSEGFGTSDKLWNEHLYEYVRPFRGGTITEIAPGHGRMTQYLSILTDKLTVVDLNETCIEKTKELLGNNVMRYLVNDGKSLSDIESSSQNLVFSYDSFVHMHANVIESYVEEISRILVPGGYGFIHHSWLYGGQEESFKNIAGRSNMSPEQFKEFVEKNGMQIVSQKEFKFPTVVDCISFFKKPE